MKNYSSNYKFQSRNQYGNRYKNQNGQYHGNHNTQHKHQSHSDHPVRDAIYATMACLGTICFVMLWWGLYSGSWLATFIGAVASAIAGITVCASFFRAFKKVQMKRKGWYYE